MTVWANIVTKRVGTNDMVYNCYTFYIHRFVIKINDSLERHGYMNKSRNK